jgi:hypothetical protein
MTLCLAGRRIVFVAPAKAQDGLTYANSNGSSRGGWSLTNALQKKVEIHPCGLAIHFRHHDLCGVHMTLGMTSAMERGIADLVWTIDEMLDKVSL